MKVFFSSDTVLFTVTLDILTSVHFILYQRAHLPSVFIATLCLLAERAEGTAAAPLLKQQL